MATEIIKFAGPDADGNFKVLQTKNTTRVEPGQIYTRNAYRHLVHSAQRSPNARKLEVTAVEAKGLSGLQMEEFGLSNSGPKTFVQESFGRAKVLDVKDLLECG